MIRFLLNNEEIETEYPDGLTVLDFVRYRKNLKGTKIGCREGDCGACTVLVGEPGEDSIEYRTMTSCLMPLGNAAGKHIVTVEGINPPDNELTPVQEFLVDEGGTQCGFCTVGFIMSMTGFCLDSTAKTPEMAVSAIDGNICRCTGYKSIERAAVRLCDFRNNGRTSNENIARSIGDGIVPSYFGDVKKRLVALTNEQEARSDSEMVVGGGTDLYVQRPDDMIDSGAAHVLYSERLKGINEIDSKIEVGASATVTDILESKLMNKIFPNLFDQLKLVSSTPIRNMATLAGNFVNASPIGDMTIWFLALDAEIEFNTGRRLPLRKFFKGYKQLEKSASETIQTIRFTRPGESFLFNFEKVCKRQYLDIATVNTAISLEIDNGEITTAHLAAGGVAPIPLYLQKTSEFLRGRRIDPKTVDSACGIIGTEIHPISDVRGSADYKRLLLKQLFRAHFVELCAVD